MKLYVASSWRNLIQPSLVEDLRAQGHEVYDFRHPPGGDHLGFSLTAGGPDPARGRQLVERAGGIREAQRRHHPDQGGSQRDFVDVQAYVDQQRVAAS